MEEKEITMNTPEFIKEYKESFRIFHSSEDEIIGSQLEMSYQALQPIIGTFNPTDYPTARELVYQRVRFVRDEKLELFDECFQISINNISDFLASERYGN